MTEPLSEEQKAALLTGYSSGEIAGANLARKKQKPQRVKATEFSRPPIVVKSGGVREPRGWFGVGRADRGAEEAKF